MGKACAYCGIDDVRMTREHVWPAWLYREDPMGGPQIRREGDLNWIDTELTVKDVCGKCNGGELSDLDSYAKELYLLYWSKYVEVGDVIEVDVDYQKLTRWLLKIAYNVSRSSEGQLDPEDFESFKGYVLNGEPVPKYLCLWVELITPTVVSDAEAEVYANVVKEGNKIYPHWQRVGTLPRERKNLIDGLILRVGVNSYFFYLLVSNRSESLFREIFEEENPDAVLISSNESVQVSASSRDFLQSMKIKLARLRYMFSKDGEHVK